MEAFLDDDDAGKVARTISGYVSKNPSNEAPATYGSKLWYHKKLTLSETAIAWWTVCTIKTAS